jgi:hypothetical protein
MPLIIFQQFNVIYCLYGSSRAPTRENSVLSFVSVRAAAPAAAAQQLLLQLLLQLRLQLLLTSAL